MENLIDGDPAANNGGWQWAASNGSPALPALNVTAIALSPTYNGTTDRNLLVGIYDPAQRTVGGVYLSEFGGKTFSFLVRYTADLLNGVPSIVIGIFAWTIVVVPMGHFSALAGGLALGVMLIPIVVRSTEGFLRAVPQSLREGALALGANKWKTVATVVIPAGAQNSGIDPREFRSALGCFPTGVTVITRPLIKI